MGSKEMTRKDFLTLTFTLIGGAAVGGACSSDNNNNDGGFGGTFGNSGTGTGGHAGTTGTGGSGGTGTAGTTGSGGAGGTGTAACSDPLPETQSASDHTHTVTIHPSMLDGTTAVTVDTSMVLSHMHTVTLQPADLIKLKNGGNVMITSGVALAHTHVYTISCT